MDVPVGVPRGPSGTFRHIAAPCESPVLQPEALRRLFHFWTRTGGTAMEASPPSPARKPPTGKKKKSDSPAAKAKRMERYRNDDDEDVQELQHPAPVTAEENSDPQKQAADAMEVESS